MDIKIDQLSPAHSDHRRSILPIINGVLSLQQIKVLTIKGDNILGNHYHRYYEGFYMLNGKASYVFEDVYTGERVETPMLPGTRVIIGPFIAHKAHFEKDSIMIEFTQEQYIDTATNDVKYEVK